MAILHDERGGVKSQVAKPRAPVPKQQIADARADAIRADQNIRVLDTAVVEVDLDPTDWREHLRDPHPKRRSTLDGSCSRSARSRSLRMRLIRRPSNSDSSVRYGNRAVVRPAAFSQRIEANSYFSSSRRGRAACGARLRTPSRTGRSCSLRRERRAPGRRSCTCQPFWARRHRECQTCDSGSADDGLHAGKASNPRASRLSACTGPVLLLAPHERIPPQPLLLLLLLATHHGGRWAARDLI